MIDLIDDERKIVFRFDTDIQSAVEDFCISIGHHYSDGGAVFSFPENTFKRKNKRKRKDYLFTYVKTTINKRGYKFEIASHLNMSLFPSCEKCPGDFCGICNRPNGFRGYRLAHNVKRRRRLSRKYIQNAIHKELMRGQEKLCPRRKKRAG
jgi:hypothetical protein